LAGAPSYVSLFTHQSAPSTRVLHSFPTRRSSDLRLVVGARRLATELQANAPSRKSRSACSISSRLFITNGPYCTIGSPSGRPARDRKSTRLNSSHVKISYAVFCLKKKKHLTLLHI